jgi:hypothetical protein
VPLKKCFIWFLIYGESRETCYCQVNNHSHTFSDALAYTYKHTHTHTHTNTQAHESTPLRNRARSCTARNSVEPKAGHCPGQPRSTAPCAGNPAPDSTRGMDRNGPLVSSEEESSDPFTGLHVVSAAIYEPLELA